MQQAFDSGVIAPSVPSAWVIRPEGGKMFGVLWVEALDGRQGILKAFSGQVGPHWHVEGFVPPLFQEKRLAIQESGEAKVDSLSNLLEETISSRRKAAIRRLRRYVSRRTMKQVFSTYVFRNVKGEQASLLELFAPSVPPWGAGDCAAPKLLAYAVTHGLRPLSLAEFWWGPSSRSGTREQGRFYPPCEDRCGPILRFLLEGAETLGPRMSGLHVT